jgi:hypothetical protein
MRIIIAIVLVFAVCGCIQDKDEFAVRIHPKKISFSFIKICIEGHLYYFADGLYEGGIAPVLTDDGKSVKCEE